MRLRYLTRPFSKELNFISLKKSNLKRSNLLKILLQSSLSAYFSHCEGSYYQGGNVWKQQKKGKINSTSGTFRVIQTSYIYNALHKELNHIHQYISKEITDLKNQMLKQTYITVPREEF